MRCFFIGEIRLNVLMLNVDIDNTAAATAGVDRMQTQKILTSLL